jgi:hypothetical protein
MGGVNVDIVFNMPGICACGQPSAEPKSYMRPKVARMCGECRTAYWRAKDRKRRGKPPIRDLMWQPDCSCGAKLVRTSSRPKRLCDDCKVKTQEQRLGYGICLACNGPRPTTPGRRFCESCSAQLAKARNRRKNVKRRAARMRGAAIELERYTTQEIAERDNWTCHLCKRKVTKRQLPHAHPRSATIDHLVPVSAGGDDVRANVALAHWSCNAARSDTGAAQLRLMG